MVNIDKKNIKGLIMTLKGVAPANYDSMDRLVSCVQFLEAVLESSEEKESEEVKEDADS